MAERVEFITAVAWRGLAEIIEKYVKKGGSIMSSSISVVNILEKELLNKYVRVRIPRLGHTEIKEGAVKRIQVKASSSNLKVESLLDPNTGRFVNEIEMLYKFRGEIKSLLIEGNLEFEILHTFPPYAMEK